MFKIENRIKNKENRMIDRSRFMKFFSTKGFYVLFSIFFSLSANAQCAMCRAALGGDENTKQAEAVNDGIVYLMVVPYLLVAVIGYLIYRMYQSKRKKVD